MFNTKISLYSICIILSIVANILVTFLISKKKKFPKLELICLLMYETSFMIVGAKIFTLLTNYSELKNVSFLNIGLSSYGAVIGLLTAIILFTLQFKYPIKTMYNITFPSIPLMYSIGKLGCFLVGCCHGIEYNGIFSISYKHSRVAINGISYFPVQICETIIFLLIFIYIIKKVLKNKYNIKELSISIILCALSKFLLDFLRYEHTSLISTNQIVSIVFIIIGIYLLYREKHKKVL